MTKKDKDYEDRLAITYNEFLDKFFECKQEVINNHEDIELSDKHFMHKTLISKEANIEKAIDLNIFASSQSLLHLIQMLRDDNEVLHKQIHDMNIIINKLLQED